MRVPRIISWAWRERAFVAVLLTELLKRNMSQQFDEGVQSYARFDRYPCPYPSLKNGKSAKDVCLAMGYASAVCSDFQLSCSQAQAAFHPSWVDPFEPDLISLCAELSAGNEAVYQACPSNGPQPFGDFFFVDSSSPQRYPLHVARPSTFL